MYIAFWCMNAVGNSPGCGPCIYCILVYECIWEQPWVWSLYIKKMFGGMMPLFLFIFLIFYNTHTYRYNHTITFIHYIYPSPFAEASLHFFIACLLSGGTSLWCRAENRTRACLTASRYCILVYECSWERSLLLMHTPFWCMNADGNSPESGPCKLHFSV